MKREILIIVSSVGLEWLPRAIPSLNTHTPLLKMQYILKDTDPRPAAPMPPEISFVIILDT